MRLKRTILSLVLIAGMLLGNSVFYGNASLAAAYLPDDQPAARPARQVQAVAATWDPITFDSSTITYTLTGFGGADDSTVVVDPTDLTNNVARVVKSATAETWAGTTVSTGPNQSVPSLPFTTSDTTMTVLVWSPDAGIQVRLKVEDAADPTKSVETEATTTVSNTWETLTFDFANPAAGTAALNLAYTYNKVSIFFNFGVAGATAGEKTYYFDDVTFSGGTPPPPAWDPITFDSSTITYTLTGFGGADDSTVVVDPTDLTNNVARVVKSATAETWAGTTVSTGPNQSVPSLPFTTSDTTMTVLVWSPDAGIQVRLKVEDAADPTKSVETEATTTVSNTWETLTFDFANPAAGTAALNLAYTYNKVSIFFNFGVDGATAGEKTYYFDDVTFGGGTPPPPAWDPITFDSSTITYTLTGFGGADDSTVVLDPTNAANNVARVVKSATAATWAGTTVSTGPNQSVPPLPFTASDTTMTVRVWSPDAGIQIRLKVEDAADGTKSVETEATTTVAAAWETLTFDFANPAAGTAALNLAYTYNKISIFFNFGVDGATAGEKIYYFDDVTFDGGSSIQTLKVSFDAATYAVEEGDTATITVTLNMTASFPVTVTYATADGTTVAGTDYTATTGLLVFSPDTLTQSFTVETLDNAIEDGARTVLLALSNPVDVELGAVSQATLFIEDNEAVDFCRRILMMVDDFEDGQLSAGQDGTVDIGFVTWSDGSAVSIITKTVAASDPEAMTGQVGDNIVVQFDANIGSWGGFSHLFMNAAGDTWISQDWTRYAGIGFWLYGEGDSTGLFFEFKENRNAGSTTDDAEIWTHPFSDDVAGWRYVEIPFSDFTRKEIGNGAPNDGLTLAEVHGWAFGSLNTGGAQTLYFDNVVLLERVTVVDDFEAGLPSGTDAYTNSIGFVTWGDTWNGTTVGIANPLIDAADPLALPCQTGINHLLQLDSNVIGWAGMSHAFENEAVDTWITQDWSSYEGVSFWVYGTNGGAELFFDITDNRPAGSTTDNAERFTYAFTDDFTGWQLFTIPFTDFVRKDIGNGAPNDGFTLTEVHGWSFGSLTSSGAQTHYLDYVMLYGDTRQPDLNVAFAAPDYTVSEGETAQIVVTLNATATAPVSVFYTTAESQAAPDRDFTPVSGTLVIAADELTGTFAIPALEDLKAEGDERVVVLLFDPAGAELGFQRRTVLLIQDNDVADPHLLDDFEGYHPFSGTLALEAVEIAATSPLALPEQGAYEHVLQIEAAGAGESVRTYSLGQDWSAHDGLSFWVYGNNSGADITVQLLDNQAAETAEVDPAEWVLAWSQDFDETAGTAPDDNIWTHELGDGALNGIVGWGNSELQYYTDSPANAAADGAGNLKITLDAVDTDTTDLVCHYGPCEYTSARLISAEKIDFAYGRIEARVQVPSGSGLWPAFWMLGTNIAEVGWPQSGEIDIMEYVGRVPDEIFGTLHGPGYSGGNGFGAPYDFGYPVADDYHTFAIEWAPDEIHWYVDSILYHSATPADVAPNEWVYNHPFYVILNMAIGGNFGGTIEPGLTYPKELLVDYVHVYQAADTAERFEATFSDDFTGWRKVFVPFSDFSRSVEQPAGAPDDGLTLTEVWGYGFALPEGSSDTFYLDQVRLDTAPKVPAISVTPLELAATLNAGLTATQILTVSNAGTANLVWQLVMDPEVDWLTVAWETVIGLPVTTPPSDSDTVTALFDASGLLPGIYTTTLTIYSNDTMAPVIVIPVTLTVPCEAATIIALTGDSPVELGAAMHFTAAVAGSAPITYTWDFGGEGTQGGTDAHPTFLYAAAGTYSVTLTVENGCGSDETEILVVVESPEVCYNVDSVALTLLTPGAIYTDTVVQFSAAVSPTTATASYSYTLDFGEGPGEVLLAESNVIPFTHTFTSTGTYTVEIAVWNCALTIPVTDQVTVTVSKPQPPTYTIFLPFLTRLTP